MYGVTSCLDILCRKLRIFYTTVIGVYMTEHISYALYLEQRGSEWHFSGQARLSSEGFCDTAAKLRMVAAKNGWRLNSPVALCLPMSKVTVMTANFRHVEPEEMAEAVYWEIRERQENMATDFCSVFTSIADISDYFRLFVLTATEAKHIKDSWRENDLNLAALTVMSPEDTEILFDASHAECRGIAVKSENAAFFAQEEAWANALWAACVLIAPDDIGQKSNFYGDVKPINWNRLCVICFGILFTALSFLSFFDYCRLKAVQKATMEVTENLRLVQSQKQEIAEIERIWAEYRGKSKTIKYLTDQRLPWHGLMVHLGTLPMDGVYLTSLELTEEGRLKMQGCAANYGVLADFLAVLEQRINSRAGLTNATASNGTDALQFTLELELSVTP